MVNRSMSKPSCIPLHFKTVAAFFVYPTVDYSFSISLLKSENICARSLNCCLTQSFSSLAFATLRNHFASLGFFFFLLRLVVCAFSSCRACLDTVALCGISKGWCMSSSSPMFLMVRYSSPHILYVREVFLVICGRAQMFSARLLVLALTVPDVEYRPPLSPSLLYVC